ncbi:MAG: PatB family C-S lyase [Methylophilus sp.]
MSDSFDFDSIINRDETNSVKYTARQALFGRADITPMWVADMDFAVPPAVTQALMARAQHPIYGYTDYPDSMYDALIHWLQRRHGWQIEREWIIMCPGVVPTLHAAVMAFAQPQQSVIVQPPVYFPFFSAVTNTGRTLIKNTLLFENNRYTIDFEHLEACAQNASMLLLCSPHNPVGRVWTKDELKKILDIAERHDLVILSDEIHADLVYPDFKHYMLATLAGNTNQIITAVAPSKTFNIAGLGLSALIVPDADKRKAINLAFDSLHVYPNNPFSITAFEAAYNQGETWLETLLTYLKQTRDFVADYLVKQLPQIKLIAAEGTYLLWLDCRALNMSDAELKLFFVQQAGLGLSPGTLFGEAGSGFMRMNIGAPKAVIADALENIKKALL